MKLLLEILRDMIALGMTGFLLFHVGCIARYGSFLVTEHNLWVIWAEIVVLSLLFLFYIWHLVEDCRRG